MRRLIRRIGAALCTSSTPPATALRNSPLSLASVKSFAASYGCDEMAGAVVLTVLVDADRRWLIDPALTYVAKREHVLGNGVNVHVGELVTIHSLSDDFLEPWRQIGDVEVDQSAAWLPPVPFNRERFDV
jgi:hypothetical protein